MGLPEPGGPTETKETTMKKSTTLLSTAAAAGALAFGVAGVLGQSADRRVVGNATDASFVMPRSATARRADCLPDAKAQVKITKLGNVEQMVVSAHGLAPNTEYDLFVIQAANAPFGLSWYQGDMDANAAARPGGTFVGRFSQETFTVAPGPPQRPWCTRHRSRTRRATRPRRRCTSTTSVSGSTTRRRPLRPAVAGRSRRSTATTTRACRCSAPGSSPR
jgi:hypothetical protein